jgi:predicted RNA-binding protein with PUA domain
MEFITSGGDAISHPSGLSSTKSGNQDIVLIGDRGDRAVFHADVNGQVLQQVQIDSDTANLINYIAGHPECQEVIVSNSFKGICTVRNYETLWSVQKELSGPTGLVLTG